MYPAPLLALAVAQGMRRAGMAGQEFGFIGGCCCLCVGGSSTFVLVQVVGRSSLMERVFLVGVVPCRAREAIQLNPRTLLQNEMQRPKGGHTPL